MAKWETIYFGYSNVSASNQDIEIFASTPFISSLFI